MFDSHNEDPMTAPWMLAYEPMANSARMDEAQPGVQRD